MDSRASDPDAAWARFQSDLSALREQVRRHGAGPTVQASLERLGATADEVVAALGEVARDPEVRAGSRTAARSFGLALGGTLRKIGDDLAEAFREKPRADS